MLTALPPLFSVIHWWERMTDEMSSDENIAHHSIFLFCFYALSLDFLSVFWTLQFHYNVLMQIKRNVSRFLFSFFNRKVYYLLCFWKLTFISSLDIFFPLFLCSFLTSGTFTRYTLLDIFLFVLFIFYLSDLSSILSSFVPNLLFNPYTEFFLKIQFYWGKIYIPQNAYILSINIDEFWEMCTPV